MRILKLGVYYPTYLAQFYRAHPGLERAGYAAQHAALLHDGFGSADFWTTALGNLGYVTTDLVINAEPLQRAWCREQHVPWPEEEWPLAVSREQIKAFGPDVLLVADYSTVTHAFLRQLQSECSSIRLTLIWCSAPYSDGEVFRACDIVLSCLPELVDEFRKGGHRAEHVNHAFEPRLLERLAPTRTSVDFSFLGSVVLAGSFHGERARILDALVRTTDLQIWSDVALPTFRSRAGQQARILAFDAVAKARQLGISRRALAPLPFVGRATRWQVRPESIETIGRPIVRRAKKPLYGLAMFSKLRESRVTLNNHIEIARHSASNMRMFEATGVGTCLLTDRKERLSDLFEPETEVATYANASECVEKVRYLLTHESERASIAAAGQRRTLRDHTFAHRASQLDAIIQNALSSRGTQGQPRMEPRTVSAANARPPTNNTGPLRSMTRKLRQILRGSGKPAATFEEVERAERHFYLDYVRDGMVVFDVGAHVGELTLLFSRFADSGQVHAFEAGSTSFERLAAVCEASGRRNVLLHHVAVSDREGEIELHVYDDAHLAWSTQADRPLASYGIDVKPAGIERVPAITLDRFCETANIAQVDLLKIDVEGAEFQVLLGATRLLAEQRIRCLTFEFGQTTFDMGNTAEAIEELLARHGYTIENLVAGDEIFPGRESARTAQFAMHVATAARPA